MSGILFLKTQGLAPLKDFYLNQIGCKLWQDQGDCAIFRHGNFLFGFCERDTLEADAMLTFFYDSPDEVDRMYEKLKDTAISEPKQNEKYNIYQCFVRDPDGRTVEIQYFNEAVSQYQSGDDVLLSRRSVRSFLEDDVGDDVLSEIVQMCRFAPTSMNKQGFYFKFIRDAESLEWLSLTRGSSSGPIAKAPMAVAICADSAVTSRPEQDGCIAAYHFMLAAWFYGLGTCWIGGMDRDEIKHRLGIPPIHYLATVTPLGYPKQRQHAVPERKPASLFVIE